MKISRTAALDIQAEAYYRLTGCMPSYKSAVSRTRDVTVTDEDRHLYAQWLDENADLVYAVINAVESVMPD